MNDKTIYLIRHAQPDYPDGQRMCLGRRDDLPLNAIGREQAQRLGLYFSAIPLEAVYTSPLLRARQTAAPIAGTRPLHVLDEMIELYGGEWEGLRFDEIRARYPQFYTPGSRFSCPPGGESDEHGLARIRAALAHVDANTQTCAAMVAHGGVNRLLLCSLLGRPLSEKRQLPQDVASVSVLRQTDGVWHVESVGITL